MAGMPLERVKGALDYFCPQMTKDATPEAEIDSGASLGPSLAERLYPIPQYQTRRPRFECVPILALRQ